MLEKLLTYLVTNSNTVSVTAYLLVGMIFMGLAFQKGWLVLGKVYNRESDACSKKATMLEAVQEKLTDQRILNERATVTIEGLREKVTALELEKARLEGQSPRKRGQ